MNPQSTLEPAQHAQTPGVVSPSDSLVPLTPTPPVSQLGVASPLFGAIDSATAATANTTGALGMASPTPPEPDPVPVDPRIRRKRWLRFGLLGLIVAGGLVLVLTHAHSSGKTPLASSVDQEYPAQTVPLDGIDIDNTTPLDTNANISINGRLQVNDALVLTPTIQPSNAVAGQLYYDAATNQLSYFNGRTFATLMTNSVSTVGSIGGLSGSVNLGPGLSVAGGLLSSSGVLSLQGQTGNVTLTAGGGIAVNGTTIANTGVLSLGGQTGNITVGSGLSLLGGQLHSTGVLSISAGSNIVVADDGSGNVTISALSGSGGIGGTTGSGTGGTLALWDGSGTVSTLTSSLLSQSGGSVTVAGTLVANNFSGNGSGLTNVNAAQLSGQVAGYYQNAGNLNAGTLNDNRLSSNVAKYNQAVSNFTGSLQQSGNDVCDTSGNCVGTGAGGAIGGGGSASQIALFTGSGYTIGDSILSQDAGATTVTVTGNLVVGGTVTATAFTGNGANLTSVNAAQLEGYNGSYYTDASNISSGTLSDARLSANAALYNNATSNFTGSLQQNGDDVCTTAGNCVGTAGGSIGGSGTANTIALFTGTGYTVGDSILTQSSDATSISLGGDLHVSGAVIATTLSGNGAAVTSVNAAQLEGNDSSYYTDAGNISSGTLNDGRLSTNVAKYGDTTANFTGALQHNGNAVCDTSGNCSSGSVTTSGGTANSFAIFTGAQTIGASIMTQDAGATTVTIAGNLVVNGSVSATSLSGNGAAVTNVDAAQLNGQAGSYYQNASNLNTGTLGDNRLSSNVAKYGDTTANFTGSLQQNGSDVCTVAGNCTGVAGGAIGGSGSANQIAVFTGSGYTIGNSILSQSSDASSVTIGGDVVATGAITAASFSGSGANVTDVNAAQLEGEGASYYTNASNISSGTLSDARLSANAALYNNSISNFTGTLQQNGSDVCTTAGNCSGVAGGGISGNGTVGTIAVFTGTGYSIGNSLLSQDAGATTVTIAGDVTVTGTLAATALSGDGSGITNVNAAQLNGQSGGYYTDASNVSSGTLSNSRLSSDVTLQGNTFNGAGQLVQLTAGGLLPILDGSNLTNVNAAALNGQAGSYYTDAGNLSSGTLSDSRLSTNVAQHNIDNNFTGALQQNGNDVCTVAGNCVGVSGGAIGGSGTTNQIALFTGSGYTIGNSILSQDASATTVTITGNLSVSGTVTATSFSGGGANVTDVNAAQLEGESASYYTDASNISSGTLSDARLSANAALYNNTTSNFTGTLQHNGNAVCDTSGNCTGVAGGAIGGSGTVGTIALFTGTGYSIGDSLLSQDAGATTVTIAGNVTVSGSVTATSFSGDGAGLTDVDAATLGGNAASYYTDAGNLSSGVLSDSRLSTNVTLQGNTFNGVGQLVQLDATTGYLPVLNGSNLTDVNAITLNGQSASYYQNADNLSSGTLDNARLNSDVALTDQATNFTGALQQGGNDVCTTAGNCVGNGSGGAIGGSGTANTLAMFSGSGYTIADSLLSQDASATTVTVAGSLNVTGAHLQHNGNDVCDTSGNCAGVGGGVTTTGGVANTFAIFTGSQGVGDSIMTQDAAATTVTISGDLSVSGSVSATNLSGNGSGITSVNAAQLNGHAGSYYQNASNLNAGTVNDARLSTNVAKYGDTTANFTGALQHDGNSVCDTSGNCASVGGGVTTSGGTANSFAIFTGAQTIGNSILAQDAGATTVTIAGDLSVTGTVSATTLTGDGSGVTNVDATKLNGQTGSYYTDAGNLSSGILSDSRLSANAALYNNATSNFTGSLQQNGSDVCTVAGNCTGVAGGAIGGSGTVGGIALFTGSGYTIGDSILSQDVGATTISITGDLSVNGSVTATSFSGNGAALTNVNAAELEGNSASYYTNAGNLSSGTLSDARLSANAALYNNTTSNFTGSLQHNGNAVCDTSGNCTGVSGGAIGGSGTVGTIAVFTGTGYTVGDSLLSQDAGATTVTIAGNVTVSGDITTTTGTVTAANLAGNGSGVTNVNAAQLGGNASSYYTNASNLSNGTLNDSRLSTNVTLQGNTFNGVGQLVQLDATTGYLPVLNGSNLTDVNAITLNGQSAGYYTDASNLSSGTLSNSRLNNDVALTDQDANFTGALQQGGNDVCTVAGNCTGVSGGAIGGSGTANKLALFTGSGYTIGDSILSQDSGATTVSITGALSVSGGITASSVSATSLSGDGTNVTNVNAAQLEGEGASYYTDASNLSSGTLADARLSTNVAKYGDTTANFTGALQQGGNDVCTVAGNCVGTGSAGAAIGGNGTSGTIALFTAAGTIGNSILTQSGTTVTAAGTVAATAFQGDGNALTNLNASSLSSGTVPVARISGSYTGITGVGTLAVGSINWNGAITTTGTIIGATIKQGANTVCDTSNNCNYQTAGSYETTTGTDFIRNQTGQQASANFNISGSGTSGTFNATSGYKYNGTAGATTTCSGGQFLQNQVVQGGIVTGGTCVAPATGIGGSGTTGTIALFTASGTIGNSLLTQSSGTVTITGALSVTGSVTATSFSGDGSGLTNVNAAELNGQTGSYYTDAGNISTGTLNDNRLTSNVAMYNNATSNFAGALQQNGNNVCTVAGNCVGVAGGAIGGSGTSGTIALFNGSGYTITNSILTQSGNTVSIAGSLNASGSIAFTGTPAASGTSSLIQIGNAIQGGNVNGTYLGLNTASGYSGDFLNFQVNGSNKFKVDSTGALTAAGTANVGAISASGTVYGATVGASNYVNAVNGYKYNGTAGATTTCSGGQFLQNQVVQGGIVTGGTCANAGTINGSGTSGTIALFTGSGSTITNSILTQSGSTITLNGNLGLTGSIILPTNGGQLTFSDLPINDSAVTDTPESYTMRIGSANALTIYGESDGAGGVQNVRVGIGNIVSPQYPLDVAGSINTSGQLMSSDGLSIDNTLTIDGVGHLQSTALYGLYSGALSFINSSNVYYGSGANLTDLDVANVTSGILSVSHGGTNTNDLGPAGSIAFSNGISYDFTGIGNAGQCLQSAGGNSPTWADCTNGAITVGALDGGVLNANGGYINGSVLYLQSAGPTYAGLVNAGTQSFAGDKTFLGGTTIATTSSNAFQVQDADGNTILTTNTADGYVGIGTPTPKTLLDVGQAQGASYPAAAHPGAYSCDSGDSLSNTTCTHTTTYAATNHAAYYYCPDGGTLDNTHCDTGTYAASYQTGYYYCPTGGSISGTTCTYTYTASCPSGYSLSGGTCTAYEGYMCPGSAYSHSTSDTYCYYSTSYTQAQCDSLPKHSDNPNNYYQWLHNECLQTVGPNSCPSGQYAVGDNPALCYASSSPTCPSGGSLSGNTCTYVYTASYQSAYYYCASGGSLSGTTCTSYYNASYQAAYYTCDSGDTLSGWTCSHTITYVATQGPTTYSCTPPDVLDGTTCTTTDAVSLLVEGRAGIGTGSVHPISYTRPAQAAGTLTFGAYTGYSDSCTAASSATADFNGDGTPDMVYTCAGSAIYISLGTSSGGFGSSTAYTTSLSTTYSVAVGDFNGDGKLDIAAASYGNSTVVIYAGNGDGTFNTTPTVVSVGYRPWSITTGDFNGDSKLDFAVSNGSNSTNLGVFINNGTGTAFTGTTITTNYTMNSAGTGTIISADVNGDGKLDILAISYNSYKLMVLTNSGTGTSYTEADYATQTYPYDIAVGDFDGNGKPDIAVPNYNSTTISTYLNDGSGGYTVQPTFTSTYASPSSVAVSDFNGDGNEDLVVGNRNTSMFAVFLGNGDGTFASSLNFSAGYSYPYTVNTPDMNGDGKPDLVIPSYNSAAVSVLLNNTTFPVASSTHGATLSIQTESPTDSGITIQGSTGQTGDLLHIQQAAGRTEQPNKTLLGSAGVSSSTANYTMGYSFTPNVNGSVTQLGVRCVNSGSYTLKLWSSTGTLLASVTATAAGTASWVYTNIAPVSLTAGTTYIVSEYSTSGYYCYQSLAMPVTTNDITINRSQLNGNNGDTFPNTSTNTSTMYGEVDVTFVTDDPSPILLVTAAGNLGIGVANPNNALSVNGNIAATGTVSGGVASPDYAENIGVSDMSITAADVVAMDPDNPGSVVKASKPYDSNVLGVISTHPGFITNASGVDTITAADQRPLALSGRVPVKVSTENGPIHVGDYLTSSDIPGVAMKATGNGAVIGVAMGNFDGSESDTHACGSSVCGTVLFFINPSATNPANDTLQGGDAAFNSVVISGALTADSINVGGLATIGSLTVTGDATFQGTVAISGDITLSAHLITTGTTPTVQTLTPAGLQGATATVTGNDISGIITITAGTDAQLGDLLQLTFAKAYGQAPHVMITPNDAASAQLLVYASGSTTGSFNLSAAAQPQADTTYTFTYYVVQ